MRARILALLAATTVSFAGAGVACSSSDNSNNNSSDGGTGGDATGGDGGGGGFALEVPCSDAIDDVYKDPGALPADKGAIIRCAKDSDIKASDLEAAAKAPELDADGGVAVPGYSGKAFTSGAHVYRVLFRTERGDPGNTPGYSSALVYIPDTPRAAQSPVIVASHGSRGQAAKCVPAKNDPAAADVQFDYVHQVYPLVGAGFAVIAPDLAGYANYGAGNNPPSAYASVTDVGKSTLDGARALKKMISKSVNDKVVLVGHSQGGGTALGALSIWSSYAPDLDVAGVAVYSPLWISERALGALLLKPQDYTIERSAVPKVAVWYFYTHGELLDGPGHGLDIFANGDGGASADGGAIDKRPLVKSFVDNDCWDAPDFKTLGDTANDVLDPGFVHDIRNAAANIPVGSDCSTASDPARCQKWMDRFVADWPHLTGAAAKVPILSLYGANDQTIPPDFATCIFDRYRADMIAYTVCYDPASTHSSIVSNQASYVSDWIAGLTLGATPPAKCPHNEEELYEAGVTCNTLVPPN